MHMLRRGGVLNLLMVAVLSELYTTYASLCDGMQSMERSDVILLFQEAVCSRVEWSDSNSNSQWKWQEY